jgi:hypothetical protein
LRPARLSGTGDIKALSQFSIVSLFLESSHSLLAISF